MQKYLGFLGAALVLGAHFPLCVKIVRRVIAPSLATWSMWSVLAVLTVASQIAAGKSDPWGMLAAAIGTIVATVLLLIYGNREWKRFHTMCAILASVAALVSMTSGPAMGQIASLVALYISGIPTIEKAWRNPRSESPLVWGMFMVGFGFTVGAVPQWSWASWSIWIQPIVSTGFNILIFSLAIRPSRGGR